MLPHVLVVVCDTERTSKRAQTTVLTCSEPFGTVCKRKLDCNTVRFKKFVMSHDRPCRAALIRDPLTRHAGTHARTRAARNACPCAMRSDNSVFRRLRPIPSPLGRVSGLRSPLARRWTVDGRAVCGASHKRLPESQNAFPYTALEPSHLRRVSTSWQAALNARKGSRRLAEPYASLPFGATGNAKPPVRFTRHVASVVTS